MSLISERSLPSWALRLAREHSEPYREVLLEIMLAIVKRELPATCRDTATPDEFKRVILAAFDRATWSGGESFEDLCQSLRAFTILTADMTRWLHDRNTVSDAGPTTARTREEAIKALIAMQGKPPGWGGARYKVFAQDVRKLCGDAEPTAPGFSDGAIEQAVRRLHKSSDTNPDNLSEI